MSHPLIWVDDPLFSEHRPPVDHPERPERLDAARAALVKSELALARTEISARDAADEELARVHEEKYLRQFSQAAGKYGSFDADTFFSPHSVAAARRAAGAAVELVSALLSNHGGFGVAV